MDSGQDFIANKDFLSSFHRCFDKGQTVDITSQSCPWAAWANESTPHEIQPVRSITCAYYVWAHRMPPTHPQGAAKNDKPKKAWCVRFLMNALLMRCLVRGISHYLHVHAWDGLKNRQNDRSLSVSYHTCQWPQGLRRCQAPGTVWSVKFSAQNTLRCPFIFPQIAKLWGSYFKKQ